MNGSQYQVNYVNGIMIYESVVAAGKTILSATCNSTVPFLLVGLLCYLYFTFCVNMKRRERFTSIAIRLRKNPKGGPLLQFMAMQVAV